MTLLRVLEPGEKAPAVPGWLSEWALQSMGGICGGMGWGGWQGLLEARKLGVSRTAKETATKYFVKGALWGGSRVGKFATLFSGIALIGEHVRECRDFYNYALAAGTCASVFGGVRRVPLVGGAVVAGAGLGAVLVGLEDLTDGKLFTEAVGAVEETYAVSVDDVAKVVRGLEEDLQETNELRQTRIGE